MNALSTSRPHLPTRSTSPVWVRRGAALLLWTALGVAVGLFLAPVIPMVVGDRSYVVMSGSMTPAVHAGDVVVNRPTSPLEVRVGDVITFKDPHHAGRLLTHRVRHVQVSGMRVLFETKGDANNTVESWVISADGRLSRVVFRIPMLGFLLVVLRTRAAELALVVVPALILGAMALVGIWRPIERSADAAPDPA